MLNTPQDLKKNDRGSLPPNILLLKKSFVVDMRGLNFNRAHYFPWLSTISGGRRSFFSVVSLIEHAFIDSLA